MTTVDPHATDFRDQVTQWVDHHSHDTLKTLTDLVAIPGIAFPGYPREPLEESAQTVAGLIRQTELFDTVEIFSEPLDPATPESGQGGPAVIATKPAAQGYPTVLLYAHHDVQPLGDLDLWDSDPLQAQERDGRLYGRGSADDKAGVMLHLTAIRGLAELAGESVFNNLGITLFIEGEEEAGSPTFHRFVENHQDKLAADVIIIADSSNWKVGVPALTTSLRGLVDGVIRVKVSDHAVHSGVFGGPILDAATVLARVIAQLHDPETGDVAIPGIQSDQTTDLEYDEAEFRQQTGAVEGLTLAGTGTLGERMWLKPALNIIGADLPTVREASNTMIPEASAKFSLRLPPGVDASNAMAQVVEFIESRPAFGAEVTVEPGEQGQPFAADPTTEAVTLMSQALTDAFGTESVHTGLGGSIPFIADLAELYPDAQILITGVEDPDTKAHSANESLHIGDFLSGIAAEILFLARLGQNH